MTQEQFKAAVGKTRDIFMKDERFDRSAASPCRVPDKPWQTDHLLWMLDRAVEFIDAGKADKANRWLGFVQGCLSCHGYDLEALKRANMPDGAEFDGERV